MTRPVGAVTLWQYAVMAHMSRRRPLCYGGDNYWFFHGENVRIPVSTGRSLRDRGYLVKRRKRKSWLTEFDLNAEGRAALRRARRLRR